MNASFLLLDFLGATGVHLALSSVSSDLAP
jgi:hypothetical protein